MKKKTKLEKIVELIVEETITGDLVEKYSKFKPHDWVDHIISLEERLKVLENKMLK